MADGEQYAVGTQNGTIRHNLQTGETDTQGDDHRTAIPKGNPFKYIFSLLLDGGQASQYVSGGSTTWQQRLSLLVIEVLWSLAVPLAIVGRIIETTCNIIFANHGLLNTLFRLLLLPVTGLLGKGPKLIVPATESADYKGLIGLMDVRTELYVDSSTAGNKEQSEEATDIVFPGSVDYGSRATGDVLIMASKLAYENKEVVKKVVKGWQMNFVAFYDCWNEFQKRSGTQVFIFTDRAQDAKAVVVAWRGTSTFDAYDWSTDLDFSWIDMGKMGKIHLGFLEALGLGDRRHMSTFVRMREKNPLLQVTLAFNEQVEALNTKRDSSSASGLSQDVIDDPEKILAYDAVTAKLREVLDANPNAKVFITGHSLGGALAALYPALLYSNEENAITDKIAAIYTFGQPRVGDKQFAEFMRSSLLNNPYRYYRVVYCNDIVPRVPFEDAIFQFKHWGMCFYFNSLFKTQTLNEAPHKNYFYLTDVVILHVNAVWELVNSFFLPYTYGAAYTESWISTIYRIVGVLLPGVGGHSPVNYVNAMRLGTPSPLVATVGEEIRSIARDLHDLEAMIRTNLHNFFLTIARQAHKIAD